MSEQVRSVTTIVEFLQSPSSGATLVCFLIALCFDVKFKDGLFHSVVSYAGALGGQAHAETPAGQPLGVLYYPCCAASWCCSSGIRFRDASQAAVGCTLCAGVGC